MQELYRVGQDLAFERALAFTLQGKIEGGFVNRPKHEDPGGATNHGITISTLSDYLGRPATIEDVKALSGQPERVRDIYYRMYWLEAQCYRFPLWVGALLFDGAVHCGPETSIRLLQRGLEVAADGVVGPRTLAAAGRVLPEQLIAHALTERQLRNEVLGNYEANKRGWVRRLIYLAMYAASLRTQRGEAA